MIDSMLARLVNGGDYDPVLIAQDQSARVTACLRGMANHAEAQKISDGAGVFRAQQDDYWPREGAWDGFLKPYVVHQGMLLIPVKGMLLHDFPYAFGKFATGYYYIQRAFERGISDSAVKGISFIVDSPGGHVAGCFELCDKIYAGRAIKPLRAFAHENAYSAAYAIASAPRALSMSRTGGVGSVGVVTMHVSIQKALEADGVEVTLIHAGKYKTDGNPYEALSEHALERMQQRIDGTYDVFVAQVARNRNLPEEFVRDGEALTFTAGEAIDGGYADKIAPLDEALAEFAVRLEMGSQETEEMNTMVARPPITSVAAPAAQGIPQADHDAAVVAATEAGMKAGAEAAQKRMSAILGCDEAKDRPKLALKIASTTSLSVEEAKGLLADAAKETAAAPVVEPKATTDKKTNEGDNRFAAAMDGARAGPGAGEEAPSEAEMTEAQKADGKRDRILGNVFGPRVEKK